MSPGPPHLSSISNFFHSSPAPAECSTTQEDSQLIRLRCAPPGCYSPLDPFSLQSSPTPAECPTTQGGFAAHPAPLRSAGLLLPPGPPYGSNIPTAGTASGAVRAPAAVSGRRDPDRPV